MKVLEPETMEMRVDDAYERFQKLSKDWTMELLYESLGNKPFQVRTWGTVRKDDKSRPEFNWFYLTEFPSRLYMHGDIGDLAITGYNYNVGWMPSSYREWRYISEKLVHEFKKEECVPARVKQCVEDIKLEYEDANDATIDDWKYGQKWYTLYTQLEEENWELSNLGVSEQDFVDAYIDLTGNYPDQLRLFDVSFFILFRIFAMQWACNDIKKG